MVEVIEKYLSIITVTKNDRSGLERTFQSLKSQVMAPSDLEKIEWIVIDGDSIDDTNQFLSNVKFDGYFSYLSEPDFGIFDAMNKGVRLAKGKYVLFLNAGDSLVAVSVIFELLKLIGVNQDSIIAGLVKIRFGTYTFVTDLKPWVCHQAVVTPKSILMIYPFDISKKYFGDLHLWMRLKRDNIFNVIRADMVICEFRLGGVGNNPKYMWKRLIERNKLGREFGEHTRYYFRIIHTLFLFILWKTFGDERYYKALSVLSTRALMEKVVSILGRLLGRPL